MKNVPSLSRARARVKRPASFSPEGFERMREDAFGHLLRVIGLAAIGDPKPAEPLACAIERVRCIIGSADGELACAIAGINAVRKSGSDIRVAMDRLVAELPTWLLAFTMAWMDAYLWGFDWNGSGNSAMSKPSLREAMSTWPRLPVGACILRGHP